MRKFFVTALAAAQALFGACANIGGGRWRCASTGNPVADGQALFDLLNTKPFACGDTILLDAGAEYHGFSYGNGIGESFRLKPQTGCNGKYTTIMSTRAAELAEGRRVSPADLPKMAVLRTRSTSSVFQLFGAANNWRLVGLAMGTSEDNRVNNWVAPSIAVYPSALNVESRDIIIERCYVFQREQELYGDPDVSNKEGLAWLRTGDGGITGLTVSNLAIRDSYIKLVGYTRTGGPWTVSAASETSPAVITSTGISAALGLTGDSACPNACNESCFGSSNGCTRVVFHGATGAWEDLNGPKYVQYVSPDQVRVFRPDRVNGFNGGAPPYDGAGKGLLTGQVGVSKATIANSYAIHGTWGSNWEIKNNHLEAWAMTIFYGGADTPSEDAATVEPGSTQTALVLSHTRGLAVGDLITIDVPGAGPSSYCTSSAKGCWAGGLRTGTVTALNGNVATVIPWGPDGIDMAPVIGATARWRGKLIRDTQVRRNSFYKNQNHLTLADAGKGPFEIKQAVNTLVDGNVFGPAINGNYFVTTRNQFGRSPYVVTRNLRLSNNLGSGPDGAILRMTIQLEDDEHSNVIGGEVWYENNLHLGARKYGIVNNLMDGSGGANSGWRHNTFTAVAGEPVRAVANLGCLPALNPYGYTKDLRVLDNLMAYGDGIVDSGNCWSTKANDVKGNLFIDTRGVGVAAITSLWPGNQAASSEGAVQFSGACAYNSWEQCELSPSSPYKGAAGDGKDPGADIAQLKDRLNGWSEAAGLLRADTLRAAMVNHPAAFQIGAQAAAIRFRVFEAAGACTLELFVNGARTTLHADTDTSAEQACNRAGNVVEGGTVTFVLGTNAALAPGTRYYYRIRDGGRVMVGEFATQAAWPASDLPISVQVTDSSADHLVVETAADPSFNAATTTPAAAFAGGRATVRLLVPAASVRYYRWVKRGATNQALARGPVWVAVNK